MRRRLLFFLTFALLICYARPISAQEVEVGGIHYYILSNGDAIVYNDHTAYGSKYHYSGDIVIPNTITCNGSTHTVVGLDSWAFAGSSEITSIRLPESLTYISMNAFQTCTGLTSIDIPAAVTEVGWAFSNCSHLKELTIRGSQTKFLSTGTFEGCPLKKLSICLTEMSPIENHSLKYSYPFQEISLLEGSTCLSTAKFQPFQIYTNVKQVNLPNSITTIPDSTFARCKSLKDISLPSTLTYIGKEAFRGCPISSFILPNTIMEIGEGAFRECKCLRNITLPNQLSILNNGMFIECDSLQKITLPNSLLAIKDSVFRRCVTLENITIPDNVKTIGDSCFADCGSLKEIVFGGSLDSIGIEPFVGCYSLQDVYLPAAIPPTISACSYVPRDCKLHVSCSSKSRYTKHPIWGLFDIHCDGLVVTMLSISVDVNDDSFGTAYIRIGNETYSEIDVEIGTEIELVAIAYPGYHFVQWHDSCSDSHRIITPMDGMEYIAEFEKDAALDTLSSKVIVTSIDPNSAVLEWPFIEGADTYIIEVHKGEELITALSFDAEGNRKSIEPLEIATRKLRSIAKNELSWQCTIPDLEANTEYSYVFIAKAGDLVIYTQTVHFSTPPSAEAIEEVTEKKYGIKILHDGQLFILRGGKYYTITGQEIR